MTMPIDQPPAIVEQVKPEPTGQQQWSTLVDAIIREQAVARGSRADVMNFTGAAANAKTEAEAADIRVAALQEMLKMLRTKLVSQGLKFTEDEWQ
jgi:hypothetical protein